MTHKCCYLIKISEKGQNDNKIKRVVTYEKLEGAIDQRIKHTLKYKQRNPSQRLLNETFPLYNGIKPPQNPL